MISSRCLVLLFLALVANLQAIVASPLQTRDACTVTSYTGIAAAISAKCTTINISAQTVPAKTAFDMSNLLAGTTVNLNGDMTFTSASWDGPMFIIDGDNVKFNGNGHTLNGNGQAIWDGKGSNGGVNKPKFVKIKNSGTFSNVVIKNSPVQAVSVGNSDTLVIDKVTVDNKAGDAGGGHNTDCFDVSASGVTIQNSFCYNQDDCLAINSGSNINFVNNYCSGGHGISIGSIASGKVVSTVKITGNTVVNSDNGLRIKTIYQATGGSVTGVTYSGNKVSGIADYGVVIEQDYENGSPKGTATNGIPIKDVSFTGTNTVAVNSGAQQVYVLCGSGSCTGTWNWSGLKTSGGSAGSVSGKPPITGYTLPK